MGLIFAIESTCSSCELTWRIIVNSFLFEFVFLYFSQTSYNKCTRSKEKPTALTLRLRKGLKTLKSISALRVNLYLFNFLWFCFRIILLWKVMLKVKSCDFFYFRGHWLLLWKIESSYWRSDFFQATVSWSTSDM